MVLASLATQEMEKPTLTHSLQSETPHYEGGVPDSFTFAFTYGGGRRAMDFDKKPNGDFVIRLHSNMVSNGVMIEATGRLNTLDETRSGTSIAATLVISREEMDRLSGLDWDYTEGDVRAARVPQEYQIAFSDHSLAGELRLFRTAPE